MHAYNIQEAQAQFKDLLEAALQGETVLIQMDEQQLIQLKPLKLDKKPRKAGSAKNLIQIADDSDAPLDDFSEYEA